MCGSNKKFLFISIFLIIVSCLLTSQETTKYKIEKIQYEITGLTRESALRRKVLIDTDKVFPSYTDFVSYIEFIKKELINQRVIESSEVLPVFGEIDSEGITHVDLIIKTKDTFNMLVVPFPYGNSNSGLKLKIKFKDYNFLGSMESLSFDANYTYKFIDDNTRSHIFGFNFGTNYPFQIGKINFSWNNDISLDYEIGDSLPGLDFGTGLSFALPLGITSLNLSFNQKFNINPDYITKGDEFYFTENVSMSLPFTIATIPNWGGIYWSPSASFKYYWDYNGVLHPDLWSPTTSFGHSISTGRVDWIGNFRKGFQASASQSFDYNWAKNSISPSISAEASYFNCLKYIGFNSRIKWHRNINGTSSIGDRLRGIKDSQTAISTPSAIVVNMDFPVRVFTTHWVKWGLWSWLDRFDFEMQIAPYVDFALFENTATGSSFNYKDGWYAGGIEVLGFPTRYRSIQGRISFGIDLARTIIPGRFVNTEWRDYCSRWEYSFGIGLFY